MRYKYYFFALALVISIASICSAATYFEKSGSNATTEGWLIQNATYGFVRQLASNPQCRYHEFWAWSASGDKDWVLNVNGTKRGGIHTVTGSFESFTNKTVSFNGTNFDSLTIAPKNATKEWNYIYRCWENQ